MSLKVSHSLLDIQSVSDLQKSVDQSTVIEISAKEMSLAAALELACWSIASPLVRVNAETSGLWKMFQLLGWKGGSDFARIQDGDVVLQRLPASSEDDQWTVLKMEFTAALRDGGVGTDLARRFTGAIAELTNNVWDHSERPDTGLLAYQIRNRSFSVTIADLGIGVLRSLQNSERYRTLTTHAAALEKALLVGVSRFEDPSRGFGFVDLLSVITEFHGVARLRTGNVAVTLDRRKEIEVKHRDYLTELPGLHVSLKASLR